MQTVNSVSVCIPAHNAEAWIGETIESILGQTIFPLEIIVSDDASTDRTVDIVNRYADRGVKLILASRNQGRYANQNRAMYAAKGELILKVDADDILYPSYIEEMAPPMFENPNIAFATCNFELIDVKGDTIVREHRMSPKGVVHGRNEIERYLRANRAKGTCVLIRNSAFRQVGGCDERFIYNGDWWLFLNLLTIGDVYYHPGTLAKYRVHHVGKSDRPIWEARDHALAAELLPKALPDDMASKQYLVGCSRRWFARNLLLNVLPDCAHESRDELISIASEMDDSFVTAAASAVATSRFAFVLPAIPAIRKPFVRLLKTVHSALMPVDNPEAV